MTRWIWLGSLVTTLIATGCDCNGDNGAVDASPIDASDPPDAEVVDADLVDGGTPDGAVSPHFGAVIFNEVLVDGTTNEDANQDGTIDAMEDEFVELVNVSGAAIDLAGWKLVETDWGIFLPRHTFAAGTELAEHDAVVVFGGGDPPASTATIAYLVSNAQDPGTSYGLDLDNAGDQVLLLDDNDLVVDIFSYGDEGGVTPADDQSMTRDPDLTGGFVPHLEATGAGEAEFSPGTRIDGTPF